MSSACIMYRYISHCVLQAVRMKLPASCNDLENLSEKAECLKMKIEEIYDQQQIFHIILLLGKFTLFVFFALKPFISGISLICVVVLFAVISLVVSIIVRSYGPSSNVNSTQGVKQVFILLIMDKFIIILMLNFLKIKLKSNGIIRSYTKIPVEIKNMMPSNVAYKQLYDV